nr:MAG TPA: replication protein [Bacteriophage sp.]
MDDNYFITFIDSLSPLFELKSISARTLLTWLCCHAEYNTGIIRLTTSDRNTIVEELGMSNNTITNNLATLKKLKIISGEKGNFQINPQIFWKGDTKTRNELLNDRELKIKFCIE